MKAIALLMALTLLSFSFPTDIQTEAALIKQAEIPVKIVKTYRITIESEIVPTISEIVGRSYTAEIIKFTTGVFVNENGIIVIGSEPEEEKFIEEAFRKIEPEVLADIASIEHIKKFGMESSKDETKAYEKYFWSRFGTLYQIYNKNKDKFRIQKMAESKAALINEKERLATSISSGEIGIIRIEEGISPSIKLETSQPVQKGDKVYIVTKSYDENGKKLNQTVESAIVTEIMPDKITLDKNLSSSTIIIKENGIILGIGIKDGNEVARAETILEKLSDKNLKSVESPLSQAFRSGLEALKKEGYTAAAREFSNVLEAYPDHPTAGEYLKIANDKNNIFEKIKTYLSWQLLAAVLGAVAALLIIKIFVSGAKKSKR